MKNIGGAAETTAKHIQGNAADDTWQIYYFNSVYDHGHPPHASFISLDLQQDPN